MIKDYTKADVYNNAAIMEDPDYFDAFLRKCEIYEDSCDYTLCINMAEWLLEKIADDSEYEHLCE